MVQQQNDRKCTFLVVHIHDHIPIVIIIGAKIDNLAKKSRWIMFVDTRRSWRTKTGLKTGPAPFVFGPTVLTMVAASFAIVVAGWVEAELIASRRCAVVRGAPVHAMCVPKRTWLHALRKVRVAVAGGGRAMPPPKRKTLMLTNPWPSPIRSDQWLWRREAGPACGISQGGV
ncbi:hypothetical protein BCR44DRAFT_1221412 [Catenaria anguillulae PL171]|uniref:Uncharacterized protein n=1 Tax=Catenaria anguillulae PL171 TaxID=765915 RepID=A0A1Y2I2A0_9FUNG|nr:hypothetical protein BCR44DRAFT_1221412 [Catenaria anguillulae PL171]